MTTPARVAAAAVIGVLLRRRRLRLSSEDQSTRRVRTDPGASAVPRASERIAAAARLHDPARLDRLRALRPSARRLDADRLDWRPGRSGSSTRTARGLHELAPGLPASRQDSSGHLARRHAGRLQRLGHPIPGLGGRHRRWRSASADDADCHRQSRRLHGGRARVLAGWRRDRVRRVRPVPSSGARRSGIWRRGQRHDPRVHATPRLGR